MIKDKIISIDELIGKVLTLKENGKVVVQSHGVFDLIHPGLIKHLNSAKLRGDVLIVTVIKDKDVRRGPGRPIFPAELRAENVASLEMVDYACVVDDEIPFDCVRRINPNIFAKGQSQKQRDKNIHEEIFSEERKLYFGKTTLFETEGFSFSSSQIINNLLDIYPDETKFFLKRFKERYSFADVSQAIDKLSALNILLIGDGIIDEYHYCTPMGKSLKAHLVVNKYLTHEVFAGGAFAIANHLSGVCKNVKIVTLISDNNSYEDFIKNNLRPNVIPQFFYRTDGPTIVKKRYINQYLNQKLFEINYLNDEYIQGSVEESICRYLKDEILNYDTVLVSDFGHGFITDKIITVIEDNARQYAVNTQMNAANGGYNIITKYKHPHFVCLDEPEIRWAAQDKYSSIELVAAKIKDTIDAKNLIVTLGRTGSIGLDYDNNINRTPIFSSKVIDTVGAGDAFFSFTAPCFFVGLPFDLVSFIGNAAGALAVSIVCNKKPVEKYELLEFIYAIMK
ncbi:MAG: hypothetical protein HQK91_02000 [Nitrospirae bacterium]|nr:hypothetical protein [Nitrospirota bacterium]MBF0540208.1 hypothetical protein [Nitrospirota bacterium]